jgi:hypothetical protein
MGPRHVMYLVEGSRATWALEPVSHWIWPDERTVPKVVSWVPTEPERILADGLLMVALRSKPIRTRNSWGRWISVSPPLTREP